MWNFFLQSRSRRNKERCQWCGNHIKTTIFLGGLFVLCLATGVFTHLYIYWTKYLVKVRPDDKVMSIGEWFQLSNCLFPMEIVVATISIFLLFFRCHSISSCYHLSRHQTRLSTAQFHSSSTIDASLSWTTAQTWRVSFGRTFHTSKILCL